MPSCRPLPAYSHAISCHLKSYCLRPSRWSLKGVISSAPNTTLTTAYKVSLLTLWGTTSSRTFTPQRPTTNKNWLHHLYIHIAQRLLNSQHTKLHRCRTSDIHRTRMAHTGEMCWIHHPDTLIGTINVIHVLYLSCRCTMTSRVVGGNIPLAAYICIFIFHEFYRF